MFLKYNLLAVIWFFIILFLTLTPGHALPRTNAWPIAYADKLVHIFIFGVFTWFMILGFKKQYTFKHLKVDAIKYAMGIAVGYGVLIEILQRLIPGRSLEVADMFANSLGALVGWAFFYINIKSKKYKI